MSTRPVTVTGPTLNTHAAAPATWPATRLGGARSWGAALAPPLCNAEPYGAFMRAGLDMHFGGNDWHREAGLRNPRF